MMTIRSHHDVMFIRVNKLKKSIFLFPLLLIVPLLVLTSLKISGTSEGIYSNFFYGLKRDSNLWVNHPEGIRSDEWLVNTQQTIAQSKAGFPRINRNIGIGQDMSVSDIPYKEWSAVFRPQNIAFFVLPLEYAFAFKWWFMGYVLIVSSYFFILTLLPKKRLFAALLSTAFFYSAFVQWWYVHGTLASLYYPLLIIIVAQKMFQEKTLKWKIALGLLLTYLVTCFALVLYPPFQIACGVVMAVFMIGYILQEIFDWSKKQVIQNVLVGLAAATLSVILVGSFILTRKDVVDTINNTTYPGKRVMKSGEFFPLHFMSSHLGHQFISPLKTSKYLIDTKSPSNQSETSNFLLLAPFLIIPSCILAAVEYRKNRRILWLAILTSVLFGVFLLEMFVPQFTSLSKLFLLDKVGGARLLIGMGLLNLMIVSIFARDVMRAKYDFRHVHVIIYVSLVFVFELAVGALISRNSPGFIGLPRVLLYSIPLPLVVYLLLKKRIELAVAVYLLFSVFISVRVNPLYRGLGVVTNNPLSKTVQDIGVESSKKWIADNGFLQNFGSINGEPSLSGIYLYPQKNIWKDISGVKSEVYNRYAHVSFQLTESGDSDPKLSLIGADNFRVTVSPCSTYLKKQNVGYIISSTKLISGCVDEVKQLVFPTQKIFVYKIRPF